MKIKIIDGELVDIVTVSKIEKIDKKIYFYETNGNEFYHLCDEIKIEILEL